MSTFDREMKDLQFKQQFDRQLIEDLCNDIKEILNEDTNKNKDAQNGSDRTYKTHNE